jgi:hypothetical protein
VQNRPGYREIGRSLRKIQNTPPKAAETKRELIPVSQVVYYLCGVFFPAFRFHVSVAASQKNPISALQKWKKHFSWDEIKIGLCGDPRHPKGHACVRYDLVLKNYAMVMAESRSFHLEVMQPRM